LRTVPPPTVGRIVSRQVAAEALAPPHPFADSLRGQSCPLSLYLLCAFVRVWQCPYYAVVCYSGARF
jgi:hypothetical protein